MKNKIEKIIATILVLMMISPACFMTISLAKEETNANSNNVVVDNTQKDKTHIEETENDSEIKNDTDDKTSTEADTQQEEQQHSSQEQETQEEPSKEDSQNEKLENNGMEYYAITREAQTTLQDGTYRIKSKRNEQKVFQVEGKSTDNGRKVKLADKLSISMSQNVIVKKLSNGYYTLTFENSKKVLDVPGASKAKGTMLQQYTSNNTVAQQWLIKPDGNGYYWIISRCNGLYVDIPAGKAVTGANIQLYTGNNTDAQKFKFEEVEEVKSEKTIEEGLYYISTALSNNKVLSIQGGKTSNSANLQIEDKGKQYQKFQVSYNTSLKAYTITAFHSDKVLDVAGAGQANGTNVQQFQGNKSKAQQWIIQRTSDGYYSIISKVNYLCLDLSGASTRNGNNVQVYEANNTKAQKFAFQKIGKIECNRVLGDGIYKISSALNSNKVLDIAGGVTGNGANLQLWTSDKVQQQKFQITYNSTGKYYEIQAVHSGRVLDIAGNGKTDGSNVAQYDRNNTNAQKWILRDAGSGYFYIQAVYSGLYLDVSGASTANGTNIHVYTGNSTKAQKFKFTRVNIIDNDYYQIAMRQSENRVLDIAGGSHADNANLQIWQKDNVSQQVFDIQAIDNTYYKIIAKHSKKVLTVDANNNVVQAPDASNDKQKWSFEAVGNNYYRIKSKSGLYLDVCGNATGNGTNVQVYQRNGSAAQMFRLHKVTQKSGIDVSFYQEAITWFDVKRTQYSDFAMIRAGYRGYGAAGTLNTDTQFAKNVMGAQANGIPIGLYFFTQAVNTTEAVQEANYVLNLVRRVGAKITYPIAIDTETANGGAGRADRLDVATRTAVCKAFCDTIRNAGYTPAIYASRDWFYSKLDMNQLKGYDIWVAHYTGNVSIKTNYKYNYDMWQYTSSGRVNGIAGNVDLNISYKNY